MREPRVYVDEPLGVGQQLQLGSGATQHLIGVLRLGPGMRVSLFNGDGHDYSARLLDAQRHGVRVLIEEVSATEPSPPLRLHLGLGLIKGERLDFALQKAVELGVDEIQPLLTERSVVRLDQERRVKRHQHWSGVIIAACEQSGRRRLPSLAPTVGLVDWLGQRHAGALLLAPDAERSLTELPAPQGVVTLLVGPEGGLSRGEHRAARAAGFTPARLGPRILRAETAPLAAIAAIQALWGDFRP